MKTIAFFTTALLLTSSAFAATEKIEIKSLQDIKKCEQQYRWDTGLCFDAYQKFVDKNPNKAFEAAKIGRTVFVQWAVFPTFDKVYQRTKNIAVCQDEDFQRSLMNALGGLPPLHDVYVIAEKYLNNECAQHLVDLAMKELDAYAGSATVEKFCPLLKANGKNHEVCDPKPATLESVPEKEVLPNVAKSDVKLERIKAYRGPEGARVFIGEVKGEEEVYLVKFQGIRGPWNNKTILHKARLKGDGSMDYWTDHNEATWNSIVVRNCHKGYCQMTVYAPELGSSNGIGISYDEKESDKARPEDLIATF